MTYSADADLDLAYGRANVQAWADVNNNRVAAEILARREWAREAAYAELNDRLRKSPYQFPLAVIGSGESYPRTLVRMEAYLAGVLLYESRGVVDTNEITGAPMHALMWNRRQVEAFVRDLITRRITLDIVAPVDVSETPEAVNDHATDDDWPLSEQEGTAQWPLSG